MSTKASIKRIALVAMSGLGLGLLSVVPAQAANNPVLSLATVSAKTGTVSVSSPIARTVGFTTGGALAATETWGVGATKVASITIAAPSGSSVSLTDADGLNSAATDSPFSTTGMTTGLGTAMSATGDLTGTATATVAAGAVTAGTITITPDLPGLYQVWVTTSDRIYKSYIWAWATSTNGATLVGIQGDGGYPSANANMNGVAGPFNQVTVRAFAATSTANVRRLVTVEGAGAFFASASTGGASGVAPTFPAGTSGWTSATIAPAAYGASDLDSTLWTDFNIATPTAGTVTVKLFNETSNGSNIFSGTASATLTINVASTGSAGVVSASLSTVFGNAADAVADATTDAAVPSSVVGTGAVAFQVRYDVKVRDLLGNLRLACSTPCLSASITGPGLINSTNSAATVARVSAITWDGTLAKVYLFNDGTAGETTLTFSWGSTILATKKITFTGSAKTLTANVWEPHITVGSVSDALEIIAKDSLGNITTYTPTALSSAPSVVSSSLGTCYRAVAADAVYGYTPGGYYCPVTGISVGTATLTIAPGSTTTNSPTVDYRVTKSLAADVALTADKASYAPGEKITLTLTVKDADGQLLGARDTKYLLLSSDLAVTSSLTGTPFCGSNALTTTCKKVSGGVLVANPGVTISAGTAKTSYFAPLVSGPVTFSATVAGADVATAYQVTPITVTVSVTETSAEAAANAAADAAAEAIDAANAATDAANLAAEAADAATVAAEEARDAADAATAAIEELATQVATLMAALKAQITTLANTVAKIAKKVKA